MKAFHDQVAFVPPQLAADDIHLRGTIMYLIDVHLFNQQKSTKGDSVTVIYDNNWNSENAAFYGLQ